MSDIAKVIGKRIRNYRTSKGLSQEKLAELASCHPTYIGQLERGEKNATVESIERIATALSIPLSVLFEKVGQVDENESEGENIPLACYEFLLSKTPKKQKYLFNIILEIEKYSKNVWH